MARLATSPNIPLPVHANTDSRVLDSSQIGTPDIEQQAIALSSSGPSITTDQIQPFDTNDAKKRGFIMARIFKLRNRRHHPATESAYSKTILANLKTILFSSWVNLLLVFVPIVRSIPPALALPHPSPQYKGSNGC